MRAASSRRGRRGLMDRACSLGRRLCAAATVMTVLTISCNGNVGPTPSASFRVDAEALREVTRNGGSFMPAPPDARPAISAGEAIAVVLDRTTGEPADRSATLGFLHMPALGARSDRLAWLVVVEGVARPAGSGEVASTPRRTWAYIDAEDGRHLFSGGFGLGPARN